MRRKKEKAKKRRENRELEQKEAKNKKREQEGRQRGREGERQKNKIWKLNILTAQLLKHTELSEQISKKFESSGVSIIVTHRENSHC